jgi:hypothetical protein
MGVEPNIVAMSINGIGLRATRIAQVTGGVVAAGAMLSMDTDDHRQMMVAVGAIGTTVGSAAVMAGSVMSPEKLRYLVDGSETISTIARQNIFARGAMRAGLAGSVAGWGAVVGVFAGAMLHQVVRPAAPSS